MFKKKLSSKAIVTKGKKRDSVFGENYQKIELRITILIVINV